MSTRTSESDNKVKPIPENYPPLTPYLCCKNAAAAIEFYKNAFGAREEESMRMTTPDGKVAHCELWIGKAFVMLADESPQMNFRSPQSIGGSPVGFYLYVNEVDEVVNRAVSAGAKLVQPVVDKFYGDRTGSIEDPFGHIWYIATHKEDLSPEELSRRASSYYSNSSTDRQT
ncbi:MAG TPA: VOC family protein [Nitrososphaera sp.]|jgi:PhnB protein|nr:VOC family protein [Nitrososphaera sp.]